MGLGESVIFRGRVLICLNQDHELMLNGPGQTGERRGISHSPGKLIFPGLSSVMTVTSSLQYLQIVVICTGNTCCYGVKCS